MGARSIPPDYCRAARRRGARSRPPPTSPPMAPLWSSEGGITMIAGPPCFVKLGCIRHYHVPCGKIWM